MEESKYKMPVIETERLILRPVCKDDVYDLFEYGSDYEANRYLTWKPYDSIDEAYASMDNYFLKRVENGLYEAYAIVWKENNKMIGTCDFVGINERHQTAEIGYVINRNYWGRGIMVEAAQELIDYGFKHLNLVRIVIQCDAFNHQSERVIQKLGAKYEGLRRKALKKWDGSFCDLKLYSIIDDDYFKEEIK